MGRAPTVSRLCLTPQMLLLISTLLYFSPYLFGSFDYIEPSGRLVEREYSSDVGFAVAFILFLLFCFTFLFRRKRQVLRLSSESDVEAAVLIFFTVVLAGYTLLTGQAAYVDKQQLLENTDRLHLIFYQLCTLSVVFVALVGWRRHRSLLILSSVGLLFTMYLGHRSSLAIAAISVLYIFYRNTPMTKRFFRYLLLAGVLFFILSVYKSIYVAVKLGLWDLVLERLAPWNLVGSAVVGMEQFTTFAHLDFVVSNEFRLACSNLWMIPISIFPFSDALFDVSDCYYNAQVQPVFFPGYRGGVAANIWAEFYGLLGYFGFPILIGVLGISFGLIEHVMQRIRSPILISGLIVALVHMSFYIQRKELFGAFISGKRAITVAILVLVASWLLRRFAMSRRSRKASLELDRTLGNLH